MNFKQAEAKLAEIAGGEYRSIGFKKTFDDNTRCITTECIIYIHGQGFTSDRTWDRVFRKKEAEMSPLPIEIEEVPEDEAMEVSE